MTKEDDNLPALTEEHFQRCPKAYPDNDELYEMAIERRQRTLEALLNNSKPLVELVYALVASTVASSATLALLASLTKGFDLFRLLALIVCARLWWGCGIHAVMAGQLLLEMTALRAAKFLKLRYYRPQLRGRTLQEISKAGTLAISLLITWSVWVAAYEMLKVGAGL